MWKRLPWRWVLPLVQLALAVTCHIYEPHQRREAVRRAGRIGTSVEVFFQHAPAPIGRISQAVNFPALVVAYPWRNQDDPLYMRNSAYTLIWIAPRELAFFMGVVLFWWSVGSAVDERRAKAMCPAWPRNVRLAGLAGGFVFGALTGAHALQMTTSKWRPEQQVGTAGVVWACFLLFYYVWRLRAELVGCRHPDAGTA